MGLCSAPVQEPGWIAVSGAKLGRVQSTRNSCLLGAVSSPHLLLKYREIIYIYKLIKFGLGTGLCSPAPPSLDHSLHHKPAGWFFIFEKIISAPSPKSPTSEIGLGAAGAVPGGGGVPTPSALGEPPMGPARQLLSPPVLPPTRLRPQLCELASGGFICIPCIYRAPDVNEPHA